MNTRYLLLVLGLSLFAGLVAGCGPAPEGASEAEKQGQVDTEQQNAIRQEAQSGG